MKKIMHVITTVDIGGAEKQLLILSGLQVDHGYDVTVVYLKGKGELVSRFSRRGVHVETLLVGKSFLFQILSFRRMIKGFDLVHFHLARAELLSLFLPAETKIVISRHNAERFWLRVPVSVSSYISRRTTSRANAVIAISDSVRKHAIAFSEIKDLSKIVVVPYSFDPVFITGQGSLRNLEQKSYRDVSVAHKESITLMTLSRLTEQKDIPTMLLAVKILFESRCDFRLRIFGEGHLRDSLIRLTNELGLNEVVVFEGKTRDSYEEMASCDLFLLTSRYEGFGLVLLEAMQTRTAIVACGNPAVKEVLGDDYVGLAEVANPLDVAIKIEMLLNSGVRTRAMEQLGSRISKFNPANVLFQIVQVYETI